MFPLKMPLKKKKERRGRKVKKGGNGEKLGKESLQNTVGANWALNGRPLKDGGEWGTR